MSSRAGTRHSAVHKSSLAKSTSSSSLSSSSSASSSLPKSELIFFPSVCSDSSNRSCCPAPADLTLTPASANTVQCGGHGTCSVVTADDSTCDLSTHADSLWWFTQYFDSACVCATGWTGAACERCAPGYSGDSCDETADVRVRRNYASLSESKRAQVVLGFQKLKTAPSPFWGKKISWFDWFAAVHHWSMCQETTTAHLSTTTTTTTENEADDIDPANSRYCYGHQSSGTPTWHRAFLLEIEHAMGVVLGDATFTLPYWNWWSDSSTKNHRDLILKEFGGDGDPAWDAGEPYCRLVAHDHTQLQVGANCTVISGPFARWSVIGPWGRPRPFTLQRCFGCHTQLAPGLPTEEAMACVVSQDTYDGAPYAAAGGAGFRAMIDGGVACAVSSWPPAVDGVDMHARVHRWLAGTMLHFDTASEPLFYMLHGGFDLALERWTRQAVKRGLFSATTNGLPLTGALPGHNRYECMGPLFPLRTHASHFVDSGSLAFGYTFDHFVTSSSSTRK